MVYLEWYLLRAGTAEHISARYKPGIESVFRSSWNKADLTKETQ